MPASIMYDLWSHHSILVQRKIGIDPYAKIHGFDQSAPHAFLQPPHLRNDSVSVSVLSITLSRRCWTVVLESTYEFHIHARRRNISTSTQMTHSTPLEG